MSFTPEMIGKKVVVTHENALSADANQTVVGTLAWYHHNAGTTFGIEESNREFGVPHIVKSFSITTLPEPEAEVKSQSDTEPLPKSTNNIRNALVGSIVRTEWPLNGRWYVWVKTQENQWAEHPSSGGTFLRNDAYVSEFFSVADNHPTGKGEFFPQDIDKITSV